MTIQIYEPIWKIGFFVPGAYGYGVGINSDLLRDPIVVEILYFNKNGKLMFPDKFTIKKEKAMTFPSKKLRGVMLTYIPLSAFDVLKENEVLNVVNG